MTSAARLISFLHSLVCFTTTVSPQHSCFVSSAVDESLRADHWRALSNSKAFPRLWRRIYDHYQCDFRFTQPLGERFVAFHGHRYYLRNLRTLFPLFGLRCGHF